MNIKVVIVGAGRFAKNYIDVFNAINRRRGVLAQAPVVHTLILTRSRLDTARDQARRILEDDRYTFGHVAGARVRDAAGLDALLHRQQPDLVCITARDPVIGDRIHSVYARIALSHAPVFCEKPYDVATGDGSSLAALEQLAGHPNAAAFGLHLPMTVVRNAMLADDRLRSLFSSAGDMEFLWQKNGPSQDLASDLALHPWSLIASAQPPAVQSVDLRDDRICADFLWNRSARDAGRPGRMVIETGGLFRGMRIGRSVFSFEFDDGQLLVRRHKLSLRQLAAGRAAPEDQSIVALAVDNPLRQHLLAILKGRPLAGIDQACASQQFLEQLKGYKP